MSNIQNTTTQSKISVRYMAICAVFTALTAVGAFIKIPIPVCPFTLQLLFTTLAGLILGKKYGALSILLYLILGLIGLPIFTAGGGFSYIFQPTFGYLIGFCVGAYVTGYIANSVPKPSLARLLCASFAGLFIVYLLGMVYYYLICNFVIDSPIAIGALILYCFVLAVPGDIVLCILSAFIARRVIPILKKKGLV